MTQDTNTARGAADQPDALIERLEDAVYEWGNYVDEDHAPRPLTRHVDPHIKAIAAELQRLRAALASHGQAPAQAAPAAVAGPSEFPHEKMDAVALGRYKVVSSDQSMFYRFAVVAGDGAQQLYIGREVDCQNMARKFAGAFLDGAFAHHSMTAAPTTQAAPQQEAQEPVAVIGAGFTLFWAGHGPIAPIVERHALKVGSPLYAAPQPSPAAQEGK